LRTIALELESPLECALKIKALIPLGLDSLWFLHNGVIVKKFGAVISHHQLLFNKVYRQHFQLLMAL